jgi:hypothetical protein
MRAFNCHASGRDRELDVAAAQSAGSFLKILIAHSQNLAQNGRAIQFLFVFAAARYTS